MSTDADHRPARVVSVDAARGLVMFTMIFVNDIAGVSHKIIPDWMRHFKGKSGMTFVDMVFPGFLFLVGMSIPSALGGRWQRGEPMWKTILHILGRTLSLLVVGILMVNNESPGTSMCGLSPDMWAILMFLSAILAFCSIAPPQTRSSPAARARWEFISRVLRWLGWIGLVVAAFTFRGDKGQRVISLSPLAIHTSWYGILGLIAFAYLVGSIVYLTFRDSAVALLGSMALLLALYPADQSGAFDGFWLSRHLGIGEMLGAHPSITVGGMLLASILAPPGRLDLTGRLRFTALFILGCASGALLLSGLYGISKNEATPSWCLWACAFTAVLWLIFHLLADTGSVHPVAKLFALAGQNVFLAYLLSEMLPAALNPFGMDDLYDKAGDLGLAAALARSALLATGLLAATVGLNRIGFRLKL